MNHYLLSVHSEPGADCSSRSPEEMQQAFQRIEVLEEEMRRGGALDVLWTPDGCGERVGRARLEG